MSSTNPARDGAPAPRETRSSEAAASEDEAVTDLRDAIVRQRDKERAKYRVSGTSSK